METQETHKATILIVDDNPSNLGVLIDALNETGFEMLVAQSGEGALRQVEYAHPDIILLDVMMPGIDGFETCRRLKDDEKTQDIPVIFMTALAETVDKVKGFDAGGVDYITKPFQVEEVIARINTHLTLRNLQQELQEKNEQLQEHNASKDKFFSIISHDLRSPLSGILALSRDVVGNFEDFGRDDLKEMISDILDDVENLYALLENLLAWSRFQRGLMKHQPETLVLEDIIARNISLFSSNALQKQITLVNACQENASTVYADKNMVDTIIRNLLSNALKFTHTQGKIEILATRKDQYLEVSVADTGVGMSAEKLSKLFQVGAKHLDVGTAGEKGTGVGLILCKDLVKKNGGTIRVQSEIGKGTTFFFTLPIGSSP